MVAEHEDVTSWNQTSYTAIVSDRQLRPAVFLDRDGVINENRPAYVKIWDEFKFLPGSLDALRRLAASPYAIVVVTNQSAIGRGIVTQAEVDLINRRMLDAVTAAGGRIDGVYCCPHHPADACACRKPKPGLLLQAIEELQLDPRRSFMVGDAASDLEAGMAVGATPLLVQTGRGREQQALVGDVVQVCSDLAAAIGWILDANPASDACPQRQSV